MKKIYVLFCVLIILLLTGCSGFKVKKYTGKADSIIGQINTGNTEKLISNTGMPFLLDKEIVIMDRDIKDFWTNIINAGFKITGNVQLETRLIQIMGLY